MPRIQRSIDIEASPDEVFAYAANARSLTQWVAFLKQHQVTSADQSGTGSTARSVIQIGPRGEETTTVCTEYDPGRVVTYKSTAGFPIESRLTFTPLGQDARVTWAITYTPPMGLIGLLGDIALMRRLFLNQLEDSLANLKGHLEQPVA